MEATAEKPHYLAEAGKPYRFTKESAAAMAKRRWEVEKTDPDILRSAQAASQLQQANEERMRAIKRLERQMESLDGQIDKARDPDDWHKLTTSRSKLFEQWRILCAIPMPGSLKPLQPKDKRTKLNDLPQPE